MATEVWFRPSDGEYTFLCAVPTGEHHLVANYQPDSRRGAISIASETEGLSVVRKFAASDFGAEGPYESKSRMFTDTHRIVAEVQRGQEVRVAVSLEPYPQRIGELLVRQF